MPANINLKVNVAANYIGRIWSISSIYLFTPVYIHLFGMETYGLVAFYSMALAIVFMLDAGLSATMTREAAKEKDGRKILVITRKMERILVMILFVFGAITIYSSDYIATFLFSKDINLSLTLKVESINLIVLSIIPQVLIGFYNGGLMGLEKQVKANALNTLFGLFRSGVVLIPLWMHPDVRLFMGWQVFCSWGFLWVIRGQLFKELSNRIMVTSEISSPIEWRSMAKYAAGMFFLSVTSGLNTQIDKMVVSYLRPLEEYAYYTTAWTLSQIPILICMPLAMAALPRLTSLVTSRQSVSVWRLHEHITFAISSLSATAGFCLVFFPRNLAQTWLYRQDFPEYFDNILCILALANIFLSIQFSVFYLSLANGFNRYHVLVGAGMLLLGLPLQYILTSSYGIAGAAVPWLFWNGVGFLIFGILINQKFYYPGSLRWFGRAALPPIAISFTVMYLGYRLVTGLDLEGYRAFFVIIPIGLFSLGGCYLCFRALGLHLETDGFRDE